MANGDTVKMESLKRLSCIDFWYIMDEFEAEIKEREKKAKSQSK